MEKIMNQEPLVSVITPCYNGENYMRPMLDSLLAQTYKNVEFFFVNDGSMDQTEEIFLEYKPKLEAKGWKVIYHKQTNGGLPNAVNAGLARFTGKYLTWPDSDDILYPNCLQRRIEYMEEHPDCDVLFHQLHQCEESNLQQRTCPGNQVQAQNPPTFDNLIWNLIFAPALCTTVRASAFLEIFPNRKIYDVCKGGQNYQLLLPLAYSKKIECLEEILACYVNRKTSHSHTATTGEIIRQTQYEDVLTHALLSITAMPEKEKQIYLGKIKKLYAKKRLKIRIKQCLLSVLGKPFCNKLKGFFK